MTLSKIENKSDSVYFYYQYTLEYERHAIIELELGSEWVTLEKSIMNGVNSSKVLKKFGYNVFKRSSRRSVCGSIVLHPLETTERSVNFLVEAELGVVVMTNQGLDAVPEVFDLVEVRRVGW